MAMVGVGCRYISRAGGSADEGFEKRGYVRGTCIFVKLRTLPMMSVSEQIQLRRCDGRVFPPTGVLSPSCVLRCDGRSCTWEPACILLEGLLMTCLGLLGAPCTLQVTRAHLCITLGHGSFDCLSFLRF